MISNIHETSTYKEQLITRTWIQTDSLEGMSPITQVYAICFNEKHEILVCREDSNKPWILPGGHPENNESVEETLIRELQEETDVLVKNIKILGAQRVDNPDNPNKNEGNRFYQVRIVCKLEKLLPQTIDPASGIIWERKFVPADKITEFVKWGLIGERMFADALGKLEQSS